QPYIFVPQLLSRIMLSALILQEGKHTYDSPEILLGDPLPQCWSALPVLHKPPLCFRLSPGPDARDWIFEYKIRLIAVVNLEQTAVCQSHADPIRPYIYAYLCKFPRVGMTNHH